MDLEVKKKKMKEEKSILDLDRYRILKETVENNEVIGIFGKRGSGKSAAGYTILENSPKESAHVVGLAEEHWHLIPSIITPLPLDIQTLNDLPWHSTIFIDEAAQYFYAHNSRKPLNELISKLEMNARKKDQVIVFATHTMRKFEIGAILDMDAILFKQPSILHAKFERKEILGMVKNAKHEFDRLPEGENKAKYAYLVSDDYEGMIEVPLPSFWCEELSNAVAPEVEEAETTKSDNTVLNDIISPLYADKENLYKPQRVYKQYGKRFVIFEDKKGQIWIEEIPAE